MTNNKYSIKQGTKIKLEYFYYIMTATSKKRKLCSNYFNNFNSLILFQSSGFEIIVNIGMGKVKVLGLDLT